MCGVVYILKALGTPTHRVRYETATLETPTCDEMNAACEEYDVLRWASLACVCLPKLPSILFVTQHTIAASSPAILFLHDVCYSKAGKGFDNAAFVTLVISQFLLLCLYLQ